MKATAPTRACGPALGQCARIMTALPATRPGEAIGQDATLKVGTQLALGMRCDALILPVIVTEGDEGLEVILHRTIERCIDGAAPAVDGGRASLRLDGQDHIRDRLEILLLCTAY
jgi:hypothetical protein